MKVFAIATILAAAVSAAPTKEACPAPIVPIPSYGLPNPPVNGVVPPVNNVIPPVNNVIPPVNNVVPPVNNVVPPVNNVIPPVNNIIPPVNNVIPPVNNVVPPVNNVVPPVNNVVPPVNNVIPPVNVAIPPVSGGNGSGHFKCPSGLYSNPQCCSVSVLGVADLDCTVPNKTPKDGADFQNICGATGKKAQCCVLPILGLDVLCQDVIGAY